MSYYLSISPASTESFSLFAVCQGCLTLFQNELAPSTDTRAGQEVSGLVLKENLFHKDPPIFSEKEGAGLSR